MRWPLGSSCQSFVHTLILRTKTGGRQQFSCLTMPTTTEAMPQRDWCASWDFQSFSWDLTISGWLRLKWPSTTSRASTLIDFSQGFEWGKSFSIILENGDGYLFEGACNVHQRDGFLMELVCFHSLPHSGTRESHIGRFMTGCNSMPYCEEIINRMQCYLQRVNCWVFDLV
jgi:hypothetical protein